MSHANFKKFDPIYVALNGTNLIEASAGTGKTYSIGILVLRFILEQQIPLNQILMVTFTKAAVAELEERIRKFLQEAMAYASEEKDLDDQDSIAQIVQKAKAQTSDENQEPLRLLKTALDLLDETSIMTIHGFCQQCLNEFAFETNQLFTAEVVPDFSVVLEAEAQKFWREQITILSPESLRTLEEQEFNLQIIKYLAANQLEGNPYYYSKTVKDTTNSRILESQYLETTHSYSLQLEQKEAILQNYWETQKEQLKSLALENKTLTSPNTKELTTTLESDSPFDFYTFLNKKLGAASEKLSAEFFQLYKEVEAIKNTLENLKKLFLQSLFSLAATRISKGVEAYKTHQHLLTYDDLIQKINEALHQPQRGPLLAKALRNKYKAVFIDEFQDTDQVQYGIFKTAFHNEGTTVFYIGDPKQSIYGWRQADLETYLKARDQDVSSVYTMNTNYRSTQNYVQACNELFKESADNDFNLFGEESGIHYQEVKAAQPIYSKLLKDGQDCPPISVSTKKNQEEILSEMLAQVSDLLTNPAYQIVEGDSNKSRSIRPQDIGILVRSNHIAEKAKKKLETHHIPSVVLNKDKVFQTEEVHSLIYLMQLMLQPNQGNIYRMLGTPLLAWPLTKQDRLSKEALEQLSIFFKECHEVWVQKGIYAAVIKFLNFFQLSEKLLISGEAGGERKMTNFLHLLEILSDKENYQKLSPNALLLWFEKTRQQQAVDNEDEYTKRVETDEEAVQIVTIHKSKGLEYPIILLPNIDLPLPTIRLKDTFTLKIPNHETSREISPYYTLVSKELNENKELLDLYVTQTDLENRRLFYVAITRAIYKCFIYESAYYKNRKTGVLRYVLSNKKVPDTPEVPAIEDLPSLVQKKTIHPIVYPQFRLSDQYWTKMSYSSLATEQTYKKREPYLETQENYDWFIFKKLRSGAKVGTILHQLMEETDFMAPQEKALSKAVQALSSLYKNEDEQKIIHEGLTLLLEQVLGAQLQSEEQSFSLSQVPANQCLHELEFNFPVQAFQPKELEQLRQQGIVCQNKNKREGMMNGFIDLFFKYQGRYYLLDWKSNYLGPHLEAYQAEALNTAMNEANYHLQYLIYSYALKKYLQQQLGDQFEYERDFGGVFYLFFRGLRKGQSSGIFYTKPSLEQLEMMTKILEARSN